MPNRRLNKKLKNLQILQHKTIQTQYYPQSPTQNHHHLNNQHYLGSLWPNLLLNSLLQLIWIQQPPNQKQKVERGAQEERDKK